MNSTRRKFIGSMAKTATLSLAALDVSRFAHAAGSDVIRLGLVGCGGRGSGATTNALGAGKDVKLVALADVFDWRLASCLEGLQKSKFAGQIQVPNDRRFVGFDAFKNLLASGVDAVILATPPGFRPFHFTEAVRAGVHCFLEKPVAVDAPGVREIRLGVQAMAAKGLSAIVGLQDRFDPAYQQCMDRISQGAIGRITKMKAIARWPDMPWHVRRADLDNQLHRPATEMEFQIRNWISFAWLSGDMVEEILIHQIDECLWACGQPPQSALGSAERREHTLSHFGNISDFLSAQFSYADGTEFLAEVSVLAGSARVGQATVEGEKGVATMPGRIMDRQGQPIWSYAGPKINPYVAEMNQWCASIRQNQPLNTVASAADSTLAAIMARTAAYTGRTVTWDEMQHSTETFFPPGPKTFQQDPPCLPDKFGDYQTPPRGLPQT